MHYIRLSLLDCKTGTRQSNASMQQLDLGFAAAVKFFYFLFFMFLTLTAYTTMGIGMLAVTPSASAASVSSVTILAAWVLFAGEWPYMYHAGPDNINHCSVCHRDVSDSSLNT